MVWGHLTKVGGDDPKAILRLRNGKLFAVSLTRELVLELVDQRPLFQDIGLEGQATWRLDDWSMESFMATGIVAYRLREKSPSETLEELAQASQGRWKGVDAAKFVRELRSEEL